jgi:hypothetical protein
MHVENIKVMGSLRLELRDALGILKEERFVDNLVVDAGLALIASRLKDATATVPTHIGVGTSSTAAADNQTALVTEIGTRVSVGTPTLVLTNVTGDSIQFVATFAAANATGALTEAGIFNASTVGTMLCRTVFTVINKAAGDSLTITWKVVIA